MCIGCTTAPKRPVIRVTLTGDNRAVKINGLDYAIISEISRDTTAGIWQQLAPVFRMPADTDMKDYQAAQPGKYTLKDSTIVFTPDTPFTKGKTYFVRYFKYSQANSTMNFIQGKKKLNKAPYTDYSFR